MKIAFLTSEYPHSKTGSAGGIGTSIKNLAQALTKLGHEVVILVYGQETDGYFWDEQIKIIQIKNLKFKGLSWFLTRKKIEKLINRLHEDKEIDIVEAPDWTGITSFIQPKKCPIVIKLNGSDTYFCQLDNRKVKWINKFHEKRALKIADAHISVSEFTAEKTNKIFDLNINFKIISNSVNTEVFNPLPKPKNEIKRILYLGTLIRKKGLLELPYIFNHVVEKYSNVELVLIGGDSFDIKTKSHSTYELMKSLFSAKAFGKQEYLGKVPYDHVKNYMATADVIVYPTFAEALPVTWLEAMAMGKIVVASNIGWASEIISNGKDGFIEHPKNHNVYAKYILDVLENNVDNKQISKEAINKIENKFSNDVVARQNFEFYDSVIKRHK
ncbi:glycosyltransferase family 4 protein [Flavobacteriaceae bacterium 14752]|uniref:glycosyltransferase family 4 protein n=1 Tax=Mesohalobacter salilacus TaxID=2491711 RepID=UPI000F63E9D7|nr:glycosyltransferase family 1 protein [Flavobacteriaceae bacterium 14752]